MLLLSGVLVGSYLLGSIPFGYVASRMAGVDIRNFGSGNIGATNVLRVLGKGYGYPVFILDFLKGLAAVRVSMAIAARVAPEWGAAELFGVLAAVASVIGHSFPPWLGFKGGKGVATSAGALFALMPLAMLFGIAIWAFVFWTTKYVSLASVATAAALPAIIFLMRPHGEMSARLLFYCSLCLAAVIIWRHRSNLSRLVHGTEPRFGKK